MVKMAVGQQHGNRLEPMLGDQPVTPSTASIPGSMITHSAPGPVATR